MPLPKVQNFTAEDYWSLSDGQRAELINGQLYDMAPPSFIHQKLIAQLTKFWETISIRRAARARLFRLHSL